MKTESGIFIFTKDRPDKLKSGLSSVSNIDYQIFVIDDSTMETNRLINRQLLNKKNQIYLGKDRYNEFLYRHRIDMPGFSFLLRPPGSKDWNLGYARNFALLFSKSLSLENVLFMDDDIQVSSLDVVKILFEALKSFKFTGAHISGLVDDSVLGHIATDLDIHNERMLSGGFMAFNPNAISDYFLNIYNEDWIWLFLQLKEEKYLQTKEVIQELKNPLEEYESKIVFQEFGEIALDGILDLYNDPSNEALSDIIFWERIFNERDEYLKKLIRVSTINGFTNYIQIVTYVQSNSKHFRPLDFKTLFEEYFNKRNAFQELFNSL
jgi:hypothetical protein